MTDEAKPVTLRAFRTLLQPLVRILLRSGVTWKEAAEVCKLTFVDVATREYGLHGRPTNISRVAIMTGIGRREVSRLRRRLGTESDDDLQSMNSATRLLTGWHLDPDYTDPAGEPRRLVLDGEPPNFTLLVRRYAPDIAPVTMLRELERVGAVEPTADGAWRVLTRYYMPLPVDPQAVLRAGSVIRDIADTADYNLVREPHDPTRFEGRATNARVRRSDAAAFRAFLEAEGQAFLERVDDWLTDHERPADPDGRKTFRLGVGVYQIQDTKR